MSNETLALGAALRVGYETRSLEPRRLELKAPNSRRRTKRLHGRVGVGFGVSGVVKNVQVLEADGSVVWESGEFKNLILNQGLDKIGVTVICELFRFCAVGTGNAQPVVTQTGLVAEVARTANYLTGAGNCGTTRPTATTKVNRRTFDFPVGSINANISELGFSDSGTPLNNLFSRVLIQQGGTPTSVTVTSSQQLRVVYELTVSFSTADQAVNINFGGAFGVVTGTGRIQDCANTLALSEVSTGGFTSTNGSVLEPSSPGVIGVWDLNVPLNPVGSGAPASGIRSSKGGTLGSYTSGSFFRDRSATFTVNEANHEIRSIFLCVNQTVQDNWRVLMTTPRTKTNLATLTITVRISWNRL
jgi:hypothetical protein